MPIEFGKVRDEDWPAVRDLCCRTGDADRPIAPERRGFFAGYWVDPYQRLRPGWSYAARREGRLVGYLTGCPHTDSFRIWRSYQCRWPLFFRALLGGFPGSPDARSFVRRSLGRERDPESEFPLSLERVLRERHPAHLHVNVEADLRGQGVGLRLMDLFFADLRRDGIGGVHVICGEKPAGFYLRLGFTELARVCVREGACLLALGRDARPLP